MRRSTGPRPSAATACRWARDKCWRVAPPRGAAAWRSGGSRVGGLTHIPQGSRSAQSPHLETIVPSTGSPEVLADVLPVALPVFVALSRFTIRNGMEAQVRAAFCARPHLVDAVQGFIGLQVMRPMDNPAEIRLMTRWTDEHSFRTWHKGHGYHGSHAGIPKGLKLVPRSVEIRYLSLFAD